MLADPRYRRRYPKVCTMAFDYILSGIVTVLITVYLAYALWRPERF
jgi:K+-transporting ATPase KdpF subunit